MSGETDSSRTFRLKPPSMPSVADTMAKSIDLAHTVIGRSWFEKSGSEKE
jgi:hypothetical protein